MLFPEQNRKSFYQMCNLLSSYVLILSIHMNPQTLVNIFEHFTSKGEHLIRMKKRKGKTFSFVKFEIMNLYGKLPIFSFAWKRKERKKTFACVIFEMMVFGKLPIISFVWKRTKKKKGKKPFHVKYEAARVLWKLSYSFYSVPFKVK